MKTQDEIVAMLLENPRSILAISKQEMTEYLKRVAVKLDPTLIRFLEEPSEALCLLAVTLSAKELEHIKNPSEKVCIAAVAQNGLLLRLVENQTERMCIAAVENAPMALCYVKDKTEKVCNAALEKNGAAIKDIPNPTEAQKRLAVKTSSLAIKYIKDPSEELKSCAVNWHPESIGHIDNPSAQLMSEAVTRNPMTVQFLKSCIPNELFLLAAKKAYSVLEFFSEKDGYFTPENLEEIVKNNGIAISSIPKNLQSEHLCELAVENNPAALKYVSRQTIEMCTKAVTKDFNRIFDVHTHLRHYFSEALNNCVIKDAFKAEVLQAVKNHSDPWNCLA